LPAGKGENRKRGGIKGRKIKWDKRGKRGETRPHLPAGK